MKLKNFREIMICYFEKLRHITAPTQKAGFRVPKTVLLLIKH